MGVSKIVTWLLVTWLLVEGVEEGVEVGDMEPESLALMVNLYPDTALAKISRVTKPGEEREIRWSPGETAGTSKGAKPCGWPSKIIEAESGLEVTTLKLAEEPESFCKLTVSPAEAASESAKSRLMTVKV